MQELPYHIAILGKNGYVGKELLTLVKEHPHIKIVAASNLNEVITTSEEIDTLFLATPANISMEVVSSLKTTEINIIDLSGAFRLPQSEFEQWYQLKHTCPELIAKFNYGLIPWFTETSQFIANPGCYATAAMLAIIPLIKENLIQANHIIIDAKSGASGAGKQANPSLMFCEIANNFYPYKIGQHQHTPEIKKVLSQIAKNEIDITLTTSILPIVRGISMTIYFEGSSSSDAELTLEIETAYKKAYADYSLVNFKEVGKNDTHNFLSLKNVLHTPFCQLAYFVKNGRIIIFSIIDNLLKGAASQAIENFNAMHQLPLTTGLEGYL